MKYYYVYDDRDNNLITSTEFLSDKEVHDGELKLAYETSDYKDLIDYIIGRLYEDATISVEIPYVNVDLNMDRLEFR